MTIAIDVRGAFYYKNHGVGVYGENLIAVAIEASLPCCLLTDNGWQRASKNIVLPENVPARKGDFWDMLIREEVALPPDTVVYHNPYNGIGFLPDEVPAIVTIHDLIPFLLPQYCGEPYGTNFRENMANITNKASHIIAVSNQTSLDLQRILAVDSSKISVIYQSPATAFVPVNKKIAQNFVRKKYKLPLPYILYAGGFNERKNVKRLLKAFADCYEKLQGEVYIVLIGDNDCRYGQLIDYGRRRGYLKNVCFLSNVPTADLALLYNGSEFTVYPSLYEGFGLPPLEAASCGKAVLCGATPAVQEIMADGAVYVDPYDITGIGNAIVNLFNEVDYRNAIAKKGYNRSRFFSKSREAREIISLYQQFCQ